MDPLEALPHERVDRDSLHERLLQLYQLGRRAIRSLDLLAARKVFLRLYQAADSQDDLYGLGLAHLGLGQYSYEVGDDYEAGRRFEVALAALEGNCRAEDLAEVHIWLGRCMAIGSPEEAMSHLETAAGYFSVIDRGEQEQACWLKIAEIAGWSCP